MPVSIRLLIAVPLVGLLGACADAADSPLEGAEADSPAQSVGVTRSELRVAGDQTVAGQVFANPPIAVADPVRLPIVASPIFVDSPPLAVAIPDAAPDADLRPDGSIRYIDFGDAS